MMIKSLITLFFPIFFSLSAFGQHTTSFFYASSESGQHPHGIALFSLNNSTGEVSKIKEFKEVINSSYVAISNDGKYLFTIERPPKSKNGLVSSFYILDEGKSLEFINSKEIPGSGACYISLSDSGNTLMVANYSQGNVVTFSVDEDGFIGDPVSNIYHQGSSVNKDRQESPHPHMILHAPKSNLVLVPDLGIDKIMLYHLSIDSKLSPALQPYAKVPEGSGPRHFAFHPSMKYGYILNELNATVTAFNLDPNEEELKLINTVSILPPDFKEFNKSADILVSCNGKFLYATNRGHNSVAILKIDESSGEVEYIKTVNCGGDWPRAFRMDPTGKFLLVANKNSGNIVVFQINENTGDLTFVSKNEGFPGPQCIRFLN